ncbi:MAG: N-acetylmuramoyl-L-alanine amidase [Lachnospiraceae bacterium]
MLKRGKRIIATWLAILMMFSVVPMNTAFAKEPGNTPKASTEIQPEISEEIQPEVSAEIQPDASTEVQPEIPQLVEETTPAITKSEEQDAVLLNYLVVNNPTVQISEEQKILVSLGDGMQQIENAVLHMTKKETGEIISLQASGIQGDAIVFSKQYINETEKGSYKIDSITYTYLGREYTLQLETAGMSAEYGVGREIPTNPDGYVSETENQTENQIENAIDVVTFDENGQAKEEASISDAINSASEELSGTFDGNTRNASGNVVVVLDPGHDTTHRGANRGKYYEDELNLKIAMYCKAELETYTGVVVYMTRNDKGDCPYPGTNSTQCNTNRVAYAKSVGANVYVSLHLNASTSSDPHGAEVYYPNNNYNSTVGQQGKELAQIICDKLVAMGLADRGIQIHQSQDGTTYPDGSEADYYGIIRRSKLEGFPGIIVEHAFLSNENDVNNYLNSDEKLKQLGITDAAGIAQYFGLQKGGPTLKGICYNIKKDGIDIGVDYTSASPTKFKWLALNLATQQWEEISNWYAGNWATWQVKKGDYWLQVQATNATGQVTSDTICFHADRNYTKTAINLNGICYNIKNDGIDVGVNYDAVDPNVNFRWMSYNLDSKKWEEISNWYAGNWATWKPKAGSYWLQVQARNSQGEVIDTYTICFYTKTSYYQAPISLEGICYIYKDEGIDVGVSYNSTSKDVKFKWQSYNLETKSWETISDWYNGNWFTWKPKPGSYFLHVEAVTSNGETASDTICFANDKDYSKHTLSISGICVLDNKLTIDVGAAFSSSDPNVKFKWQVLDLKTQQWTKLTDWTNGNWASWNPSDGQYWIYVDAMTSDGVTASYCIGYTVSARYEIMGNSQATLAQLMKYYKSGGSYPSFYATSDAPTLEKFCQIYMEECVAEGVKVDVAFCQAMKETGFLKYPGVVSIEQFNFAGIGATDSGGTPNSFASVREGVRAQVQHLKAYASSEPLKNVCVDPRFKYVTRGTATYVEWLGINENPYGKGWATEKNYGYNIRDRIIQLLSC